MYAFEYRRPGTLGEAERALYASPGAKLLARGQTLIPTLKLRLNRTHTIIDLGAVAGLDTISRQNGKLVVGAMATHAEIAVSPVSRARNIVARRTGSEYMS